MSKRSSAFRKDMAATFIQDDKGNLVSVEPGKTRVILITRRYGIEVYNPVWGTEYADVGTVMRASISKRLGTVSVDWDNCSMSMLYNHKDLRIHKEMPSGNPNSAFKRKKEKTEKPFKFGDAPLKPKDDMFDKNLFDGIFKYEEDKDAN